MRKIIFIFAVFISYSSFSLAQEEGIDWLIDQMEKALKFEQNNFTVLSDSKAFEKQRQSECETYKGFAKSLKSTELLIATLKEYKNDHSYANVVLMRAFNLRFEHLGQSLIDFYANIDWNSHENSYFDITESTVSELKSKTSLEAQWKHIISRTSLDRFQLLSVAIHEILKDMNNKGLNLSETNKLWLRCSRTLHPLLRGEVTKLENPENAHGTNISKHSNYDHSFDNEVNLCNYWVIPTLMIKYANLSLGAQNQDISQRISTHEYYQLPKSERKVLAGTLQKLENPSLPIFDFPGSMSLGHSGSETSSIEEEKIERAPLEFKEKVVETSAEFASSSNFNEVEDLIVATNPAKTTLTIDHEVDISNDLIAISTTVASEQAQSSYEENTPSMPQIITEDALLKEFVDYIDHKSQHAQCQEKKAREKNASNQTKGLSKKPEISKHQALYLMIKERLKTEDTNWLMKLFNNEFKVCAYRDFSRIWERLNGINSIVPSKKGSSHFKLCDPSKEVVGGIFTHGYGQEYWGSAVHDLKQHFIVLGITHELLNKVFNDLF